jgi:hypothetical protein
MKQEKITSVGSYEKPSTGQAVSGHTKRVHVNAEDAVEHSGRSDAVKDAIAQDSSVSSGVLFLAEGETAAKEYTLPDGRRVGLTQEVLDLRKSWAAAGKAYKADPTPENIAEAREAKKAYQIAFAGSVRNYSLAQVHMNGELMSMIRPRPKEEQELVNLVDEARALGDELGVSIVKRAPAHEEFMRMQLRETAKTPDDAARRMLGDRYTPEAAEKLLKKQKPGWIQKRITRGEIKRVKLAMDEARAQAAGSQS